LAIGLRPVAQAGLVSDPEDRTTRVIVGRKGSGKTVYLRRLQAAADEEESVYAGSVESNTPTTAEIIQFCQRFRGNELTEQWSQAWRVAILGSIASHLLFSKHLREYGEPEDRARLAELTHDLMGEVRAPRSVYHQLADLINAHRLAHEVARATRAAAWGDLEHWIAEVLQSAPPIFFYLDAVDEEYASAPNYWLRCQKGLFYQVMRFLRDPVFGGRLHLVISVRDNVFSSVLRSEHATRYRTDPHVRILAWDRPAIGDLLRQKLERLAPEHVMRPNGERTVATWLGTRTIFNERRKIDEEIDDYLVRHTRLLPRDIVLLGNELTKEVERAKAAGEPAVRAEHIREVVSRVAAWCGDEQLFVCGNQVLGDHIPRGGKDGTVETYVSSDEYRRDLKERIGSIIRSIGTDGLTLLAEEGRSDLGEEIDLPTVLWQNGLLGFGDRRIADDDWIFHGVEDVDRFHVPVERERYALHPCLLDTLGFAGDGNGSRPVHPWRRGIRS
jgi:hypothetical protein